MAKKSKIKHLIADGVVGSEVKVFGWVRTFRNNQFIALNDGSCIATLQVVVDYENMDDAKLKRITTGAAISATGKIVESQGRGQRIELVAEDITIYGDSDPEKYPLQPKKHSLEFLREIAHLRFRTNTFGAIFRIRHSVAFAIHEFFNSRGFVYLHTPEKSKPMAERSPMALLEKLQFCLENDFERVSYTDAIRILQNSKPNKKKKFQFVIEEWGADLQSEHERYLVEKHFKKPVILFDYPKDIKAFYMRQNDDEKTVGAMDILFPGIGEIIGGSQREERMEKLQKRMAEMDIPEEEMEWFLDTRRFGTCPHAGFGLGFERLVLFVTGMANIRDVIPFPRYPGSAEF